MTRDDDAPGGWSDPDKEGQERYWDGTAWTDECARRGGPGLRLPEHVPELQRALAAATADIDAVEDRLSTSSTGRVGRRRRRGGTGTSAAAVPTTTTST